MKKPWYMQASAPLPGINAHLWRMRETAKKLDNKCRVWVIPLRYGLHVRVWCRDLPIPDDIGVLMKVIAPMEDWKDLSRPEYHTYIWTINVFYTDFERMT